MSTLEIIGKTLLGAALGLLIGFVLFVIFVAGTIFSLGLALRH